MTGVRAPRTDGVPVPVVSDEVLTALLKARSGKSRTGEIRQSCGSSSTRGAD